MHKVLSKKGLIMTAYGYARVSTNGQDLAAQEAELMAAGAAKVFKEKVSGAKTDRAELAKLIRRLEPGDVLIVTRLDRLARSTRDLLNVLATVGDKGAGFRSLADPWADTNTKSFRRLAPNLPSTEEALAFLVRAVEAAGRRPGEDVVFALDAASSELFEGGRYVLAGENKALDADGMVRLYEQLCENY